MSTPDPDDRPTILAVDDSADILAMITGLLKELYKIKVAKNGETALAMAASSSPSLILLDILMPGADGFEVCARLKADPATREIPVIFLTAKTDGEDEERGFELGAADYITKPINPIKLLARVKTHTALSRARIELQEWNNNLKRKVISSAGLIREKSSEQSSTSLLTNAFSNQLEMTDAALFNHTARVGKLVGAAALRMSLDSRTIRDLQLAVQLHDIGKLGENSSRSLPAEMSANELQQYRQHPVRGQSILGRIESLQHVGLMVRHHHEAFDGSGFPDGLKGSDIPLGARLIGIADYLDHAGHGQDKGANSPVLRQLSLGAGTLFAPELIEYFIPPMAG